MRKLLRRIIHILDGTPAEYGKQPERGQSLVELAFTIPILIIMLVGLIEIGWYGNNYINLIEAAKVGARRGPFLNGDNAPQAFDPEASVAPGVASAGYPILAGPGEPGFDPVNPRNRMRGIKETNSDVCGGAIDIADYGFYNIIVCTVLSSLDPLELAGPNDDIVVSVFSVQHVNNGVPTDGSGNPIDNPNTNVVDYYDIDLNADSSYDYPAGHQVIVVGRWPYNANECALAGVNGARDPGDYRDPFDYIVNNDVDTELFNLPNGDQLLLSYELAIPIYGPSGSIDDYQGYNDVLQNELQRGWAYTGRHEIDPVDGFTETCSGSEFTLKEVEDRLNLPNFVDPGDPLYQDRRRLLPNQGLVLVELFWEHSLLFGDSMPLFNAANFLLNEDGSNSTIRVWSAFPAAAAEPNIIYQPEE